MDEIIEATIAELHKEQPQRGIERFKKELKDSLLKYRRYELRRGQLVDQRGVRADLKNDLRAIIDASSFIPRKGDETNSKYVSPWNPLDSETLQKYAATTSAALEKLFKLDGFVPVDQAGFQKALTLLSRTFVFESNDEGLPIFRKVNQNGLVGDQEFTFDQISTLVMRMNDRSKSQLASELKRSERIELAKRLLNNANPKKEVLEAKVEELKRNEIAISIPPRKLPSISRSTVEQEFIKKEAVLRGLDVANLGSTNRALLQNTARIAYDELSNVYEVQKQINEIELQPAANWENLTY